MRYVILVKNKYRYYWELVDDTNNKLFAFIKSIPYRFKYDEVDIRSYEEMHGGNKNEKRRKN